MNIIEAHKSGKAFKRPHWVVFVRLVNDGYDRAKVRCEDGSGCDYLQMQDVVADDYQLEPNGAAVEVPNDD